MATVPIAVGLVGNLATSTVKVETRWWAQATWVVTGLLVVIAVAVETRRSFRGARPARISNLPARNLYFTGRASLLELIHRRVRSSTLNRAATAIVAVQGIGGVGKTQLALEYSHRYTREYGVLWWVNAESVTLATTDLLALAQRLGVPVTAQPDAMLAELWTLLADRDDWLLVYDNADDEAVMARLRPRSGGRLLITGRAVALSRLPEPIEVTEFTHEESLELLKAHASLSSQDLDHVAEALGHLPLAVEQAGCFLAETGLDAAAFLGLLSSQPVAAGLDDPTLERHPGLAAMVGTGRARLQAIDPNARALIDKLAFLAPESLPLTCGSNRFGVCLGDTATTLQLVRMPARLGLVRHQDHTLLVHRLVQALVHSTLDDEERPTTLTGAQRLLATVEQGNPRDPAAWPDLAGLTPHVQCLSTHLASEIHAAEDTGFRTLLGTQIEYLNESGHASAAHTLAGQAMERWTRTCGSEHPDTLRAAHGLARALYWLDDLEGAREVGQTTLDRRRRVLGAGHPDTVFTGNNLAFTFTQLGEFQQARDLCQEALAHRRVLGDDHRAILGAAFALAAATRGLGDYQRARELDEDILERHRSILGDGHPDTLRSARNLAKDLFFLGNQARALNLLQDTLRWQRGVLGDSHPETRRSEHDLQIFAARSPERDN
ncbi:FxSxx-COOH system tetratricopeptide repeat protein [Actinomadura sp. GTD37]|uniref:FxSxx-COOH system tetratricopeptide repeat protein n=1 Tax=Actinomadura sp. GTD37 TaxID=1778030 RepID=UPI0035C22897